MLRPLSICIARVRAFRSGESRLRSIVKTAEQRFHSIDIGQPLEVPRSCVRSNRHCAEVKAVTRSLRRLGRFHLTHEHEFASTHFRDIGLLDR